jgi:hypothetical protein
MKAQAIPQTSRPRLGARLVPNLMVVVCCSSSFALAADDEPVVVSVGQREVRVSELERRIAKFPAHQLRARGKTAREIRRAVLDELVVRELLLEAEADRIGLALDPKLADRLREVLRDTLHASVVDEVERQEPVTSEQVRAYYDRNRARFRTAAKIRIWRIVVDDRGLAAKIIERAQKASGVTEWSEFSRQHSLDEATKLRDGDLGFVRADGSTDVPRVRVDPRLFQALEGLEDGELRPEPLDVDGRYMVLWRRGSVGAAEQGLEAVAESISELLLRERVHRKFNALLDGLYRKHVRNVDAELVKLVEVKPFSEAREQARRATAIRRPEHPQPPRRGERGLR